MAPKGERAMQRDIKRQLDEIQEMCFDIMDAMAKANPAHTAEHAFNIRRKWENRAPREGYNKT